MNDCAIFIPARYQSTRFPGKPLAMLRGCGGVEKSLIQRSWEAAVTAAHPDRVWVLTDDDRIAAAVTTFGGQVVMTPASCRNGTERCAAALDALGDVAPIIINLQGDAPLSPAFLLPRLAKRLADDSEVAMSTPAVRCSAGVYQHLVTDAAAGRVGGTTVVFNNAARALYFSKRVIPYVSADQLNPEAYVHLHLGIYAYRPDALRAYAAHSPSTLEELEGLEQLRFLDMGSMIAVEVCEPLEWDCIELNNPSDTPAIEAVLRARGLE